MNWTELTSLRRCCPHLCSEFGSPSFATAEDTSILKKTSLSSILLETSVFLKDCGWTRAPVQDLSYHYYHLCN